MVSCNATRSKHARRFADRLRACRDIRLVPRPSAQHVAEQRQVRRDELDVVAGHVEQPARRNPVAGAGARAIGASGADQGAGQERGLPRGAAASAGKRSAQKP
jgi:hypothetical protein